VLANAEAERLFGYGRAELIGQSVEMLIPSRLRTHHQTYRQDFARDPSVRAMGAGRDLFGLRSDGAEFPVEVGLNPIDTSAGLFVLSVIIDITERKRAEQALRDHAIALERSNRDLREFATIASHDLQEPLRKTLGFADMLLARYADAFDDSGAELMDRMIRATKRMQLLVDGMLTYARLGDQGAPFEAVNLSVLVRDVALDLEESEPGIPREVEIADLPIVQGNPTQLRQLFQNLLSNAFKFAKKNDVCRVRVYAEDVRAMVPGTPVARIIVEDSGIGFEQKYAAQIFGMLQRLHPRGIYEGSGMGLAICRRIVERHGGVITAEGTPDAGAKFLITLPLYQV
jgi:PAS domain S-box-containing protein